VKDTVYNSRPTSQDEVKLRIVAEIEETTPQQVENSWKEIEYRLDL
jgi:hypothetical protein